MRARPDGGSRLPGDEALPVRAMEKKGSISSEILADEELLRRTGLLHAHRHRHDSGIVHSHPHLHRHGDHEH